MAGAHFSPPLAARAVPARMRHWADRAVSRLASAFHDSAAVRGCFSATSERPSALLVDQHAADIKPSPLSEFCTEIND